MDVNAKYISSTSARIPKACFPDADVGSNDHEEYANRLIADARALFEEGHVNKSLDLLKEAYQHLPSDNIARKINKLENFLADELLPNQLIRDKQCSSNYAPFVSSRAVDAEVPIDSLNEKARMLFENGQYDESLRILREINLRHPSDKIRRKIERIEAYLSRESPKEKQLNCQQYRSESHNIPSDNASQTALVTLEQGFMLPKLLYDKLYPYQRTGVSWLWNLHKKGPGGILADDMGLGKTVQVIAFLTGLSLSKESNDKPAQMTAMIVMPVSVLVTWETELKRWAPALRVAVYHEGGRKQRIRSLSTVQRRGGVILTTYGMATTSWTDFATDVSTTDVNFLQSPPDQVRPGTEFTWSYIVLDEAHKIKNPAAKSTQALMGIAAHRKLLLTGTAIQNNLKELWSLYNFTHKGGLLGRMCTFQFEYGKPITRSRQKDATRAERVHGHMMSESLRRLIQPFFLRRTKNEVLPKRDTNVDMSSPDALIPPLSSLTTDERDDRMQAMPQKTELVVWLYLRQIQEQSYRLFLQSNQVKELLTNSTRRSPLMELVILKKLCDHPRLLTQDQCDNLNFAPTQRHDGGYSRHHLPPAAQLRGESGKLVFLSRLMNQFLHERALQTDNPPRTLIFSQSLRLLDMTEKVVLALNERPENVTASLKHRVLRLDGRVNKLSERLDLIRRFEKDKSYTVMLLTTQVGGVGLTLTAANRVIILDPSWNPAIDAQAVDRAYRIGQKSDVLVYRLITCGTVEEKIYRRQIFKDSIIRKTTGSQAELDPYRYFTNQDLRELFTFDDARTSATQKQLEKLHKASSKWSDERLHPHLAYLTGIDHKDTVFGISFHDLMFSRADEQRQYSNNPGISDEIERENAFLHTRRLAAESNLARESADPTAAHVRNPLKPITSNTRLTIPSTVDSHRPMLNRPNLGLPGHATWDRQTDTAPVLPENVLASKGDEHHSVHSDKHNSIQNASLDEVEQELAASMKEMSIMHQVTPHQGTTGSFIDMVASPLNSDFLRQARRPPHLVLSRKSGVDFAATPRLLSHSTPLSDSTSNGNPTENRRGALLQTPLMNKPVNRKSELMANSVITISDDEMKDTDGEEEVSEQQVQKANINTSESSSHEESSLKSFITTPNKQKSRSILPMDITVAVDDDQLAKTVDMKSMHQILARSGLLECSAAVSHEDDSGSVEEADERFSNRKHVKTEREASPATAHHRAEESVLDSSVIIDESLGESYIIEASMEEDV